MKFIKRLIILSGEKHKGTLSIERNAYGVFAKFNAYGNLYSLDLVLSIDDSIHYQYISGCKSSFELTVEGDLEKIHAAVFFDDKLIMYGTNQPEKLNNDQLNKLRSNIKKTRNKQIYTTRRPTETLVKIEYEDEKIAEKNYYPESINTEFKIIKKDAQAEVAATNEKQEIPKIQSMQEKSFDFDTLEVNEELEENIFNFADLMPSQMEKLFLYARLSQKNLYKSTKKAENINIQQEEIQYETQTKSQNDSSVTKQKHSIRSPLKLFQEQRGRFEHKIDSQPNQIKSLINENENNVDNEKPIHKVAAVKFQPFVEARQSTFYERHSEEINKLFVGTREKNLEKLIPNSKWVKINFDNSNKFYVVGLIGQDFLCYGVPSEYSPEPPEELKGYSWWLPLDSEQPKGKGYWIMYQNLVTGQTVIPTEFE